MTRPCVRGRLALGSPCHSRLPRTHTGTLGKQACEVRWVGEAAAKGDIADCTSRGGSSLEQEATTLQADFANVAATVR